MEGTSHIGNGFFLLSSRSNFERMNFGGHGLLVLILFGFLGFLSAMIFPDRSARIRILKAVLMLSFVFLILIKEGQQTPSFFTPRIIWVPPVALLLGLLLGEKIKKSLESDLFNGRFFEFNHLKR